MKFREEENDKKKKNGLEVANKKKIEYLYLFTVPLVYELQVSVNHAKCWS